MSDDIARLRIIVDALVREVQRCATADKRTPMGHEEAAILSLPGEGGDFIVPKEIDEAFRELRSAAMTVSETMAAFAKLPEDTKAAVLELMKPDTFGNPVETFSSIRRMAARTILTANLETFDHDQTEDDRKPWVMDHVIKFRRDRSTTSEFPPPTEKGSPDAPLSSH